MIELPTLLRTYLLSTLLGLGVFILASGCQKTASAPEPGKADAGTEQPLPTPAAKKTGGTFGQGGKGKKSDEEGREELHLKADEVDKLGVQTAAVQAESHAPEASGFGVVIPHETLAQALADLRTATAVARQSQAALARGQRLAGTPGAMPLDTLETAQRQSTVDQAALALARQRLSATFGQDAPWNGREESPILNALAGGVSKLVRVTFPMSAVAEARPSAIRLGRIGVGQTARTWDSGTVWSAPADATVPGRSFFTIFKGNTLGEGERLLAWTPVGQPAEGVFIPAAAALISGGKYWCYIEEKPGSFVRTEFEATFPISGGYFVTAGVKAGDKVVIKAAGQLLAKELNPGTEVE